MMPVLHVLAAIVLWVWGFWALYVLVMGLYRAKLDGRLTGVVLYLAWPWYAFGWVVDLISNMTLATVFFLDVPRELLVTSRLQRYMRDKGSWRGAVASFVCDKMLDVFDPSGKHC